MSCLTIVEIKDKAENLKQYIWEYFFIKNATHKGVKDAMNNLLDELDRRAG